MRTGLISLLLLGWASTGLAQTATPAPIAAARVEVLPAVGDVTTVAAVTDLLTAIGKGSANCNLAATPAPAPGTPLVNPLWMEIEDPFIAGRWCRIALPQGLPNGTGYRAVARFEAVASVLSCQNSNGQLVSPCRSERSAVAIPPFDIAGVVQQPAPPKTPSLRQ